MRDTAQQRAIALTNQKLEAALDAASRGFRVFPISPGSKKPPKDFPWKERATTDAATIRDWWTETPDLNIGIAAGHGLLVVDADTKDGKPGLDSLDVLGMLGLPAGLRVATPSGGVHVYLAAGSHRNRVGSVPGYPGIDIRSDGGYVLGPGSTIDGKPYRILVDTHVIDASPSWFDEMLRADAPEHMPKSEQPLVDLDRPENMARAIDWLTNAAPEAVEGAGGDDATYRVAAKLRDLGLSEAAALEAMLEHWNENKASPPWQPDELARKVENAFRYASGGWGAGTAAGEFGAIDIGDLGVAPTIEVGIPTTKPPRWLFETIADLRALPKTKWLVRGWIPENATGILYGKWGSGKTFIIFDLALHLAYGRADWYGAELPGVPSKVLVLAREGHAGFIDRINAFKRHHSLTEDPGSIEFMRVPINFMDDGAFKDFLKALAARRNQFSLVIVDTIARVLPGVDINAPEIVTTFMERCERLTKVTGAPTIGAHHQNKSGSMFGSIFFEANADFVFEVERTGAETEPLREGTLRCTKMKDGPDRWSRDVRYVHVATEDDRSSLAVTSIQEKQVGPRGGLYAETLEAINAACRNGVPYSRHPRARTKGRYAAANIARLFGVDEERAAAAVEALLVNGLVEEKQNPKTHRRYLAPVKVVADPFEDDLQETIREILGSEMQETDEAAEDGGDASGDAASETDDVR